MNEPFILPVVYNDTELEFRARFERWGYSHRIAVLIGEYTFTFEPDEQGGYRALSDNSIGITDMGLLQAIAEKLVRLNA